MLLSAAPQQGLVAMWVTNRERIHRFLEKELLPHWGLTLFRTWLWVKVGRGGGSSSPSEPPYSLLNGGGALPCMHAQAV